MTISERIFVLVKKKKMTQQEFAKRVGIANSTVSEWKNKNISPSTDKIMNICEVLDITADQLLSGRGIDDGMKEGFEDASELTPTDRKIIVAFHGMQEEQKKRLLVYIETLVKLEELEKL